MAAKSGVEMIKNVAKFISKGPNFDRVTQMVKITSGGDGSVVGEFTVTAEHLNRLGSLHGGLTATILDNITTYALMSKGSHPGVSSCLNVSYLSTAKPGDVIEVDAVTLHAGRKMAYIECVLRNKADGRIIAKGGQTKFVDFNKSAE
ncbi:acyl-coenzyme A thioesterase 13 [Drosophila grimshawi]|uniref:GH16393 n=1 Tax=Drosophila grimshawi TaxID=7222 RepID=B4IZC6_DROGR|nr:acyl-coenzyme A thioesterase 13 [Drosophila grimshawi]EDV96681.1 GH16393 [Drosophila grimshawi]